MNYDYSLRLESGSLYVDKRLHGSGKLELPYARAEGGIAIIMKNEWYLCTPKNDEVGSGGGSISFYAEPTREGTDPVVLNTSSISEKQAEELREILDGIDTWVNDAFVDRLAYYFDGHIEFAGNKKLYFFTYEHNVIYFNQQFAEISTDGVRYAKDIALTHNIPVDLYLTQFLLCGGRGRFSGQSSWCDKRRV